MRFCQYVVSESALEHEMNILGAFLQPKIPFDYGYTIMQDYKE